MFPLFVSSLIISVMFSQIAEICFLPQAESKPKISGDDEKSVVLGPNADPETNVYSFGILLLEIISGKLPYSEEQGPLEKWVSFE